MRDKRTIQIRKDRKTKRQTGPKIKREKAKEGGRQEMRTYSVRETVCVRVCEREREREREKARNKKNPAKWKMICGLDRISLLCRSIRGTWKLVRKIDKTLLSSKSVLRHPRMS